MRIIYVVALLFLGQVVQAQAFLSRKQAEDDAKAFQKMILKVHPAPDAYITKDSFRQIVADMLRFEGDSISTKAWEIRVRQALLPVGCGHTYMVPNAKKGKKSKKTRHNLPFRVFVEDDRVWVTGGADSLNTPVIPPGSEILAVGAFKMKEVSAFLRKHQPSDGFNTTFQQRVLNRDLFYNYLFTKYYSADSVQYVTWADRAGVLHYQKVTCLKDEEMAPLNNRDTTIKVLHSNRPKTQLFYFHPQDSNIGVLKLQSFSGRGGTKLFQKVMAELNTKKTPYLVIDLRDNTGGSFASSVNLIRYTTSKKFTMNLSRRMFRSWQNQPWYNHLGKLNTFIAFDLLYWGGKKWIRNGKVYYRLKFKPSKKHHFNGQVFVLVNGMSFSASSQTATFIKENSNAVIIGQETGGGARAINGMQIPVFRLPESKLLIHIPQMHLDYRMGKDEGRGVLPHIETRYTIENTLENRDLEWEAVRQWITEHSLKNDK
jgi:hypothetical protein